MIDLKEFAEQYPNCKSWSWGPVGDRFGIFADGNIVHVTAKKERAIKLFLQMRKTYELLQDVLDCRNKLRYANQAADKALFKLDDIYYNATS